MKEKINKTIIYEHILTEKKIKEADSWYKKQIAIERNEAEHDLINKLINSLTTISEFENRKGFLNINLIVSHLQSQANCCDFDLRNELEKWKHKI